MRKTHVLKCWKRYFEALINGSKTFEIRRDDRGFGVGDVLELHETLEDGTYTSRVFWADVTYITSAPEFVLPGYVVMSIVPTETP